MASPNLLFLHPLVGHDDAWSGLLAEFAPGESASQEQLDTLLHHPLRQTFIGHHHWLIPAYAALEKAPAGSVAVFQSAALFGADPAWQALDAELRRAHRKLALAHSAQSPFPATGTWDYVLIEASEARCLAPLDLQKLASRSRVVGLNVRSYADHNWLKANGCHLSTGEYLLTRQQDPSKADLTRMKLLQLLALIAADADTPELDTIFRQELKLSYSLLRLVNSAALAPRNPITSFAHAINLLGRRELQRWLQLLVFADPNNGQHANPLLLKAATRGHLMEVLARPAEGGADTEPDDFAFMVGTFSLLPALLNLSPREILQHLPLAEVVREALLNQTGPLGALLAFLEAAESRELSRANTLGQKSGIAPRRFLDAQLDALHWASRIHLPH